MNVYNTEVLCVMLDRLAKHQVIRSREARKLEAEIDVEAQEQDKKDKTTSG
jgi:hypothetical protein